MDLPLQPEDEAFRDEVRAFLVETLNDDIRRAERLTPGVGVSDREIERNWRSALNGRGWVGAFWPVECGGPGWSPVQRFIFETECARAGAPRLAPMSARMVSSVLIGFGTAEQKAYYLPRILRGEDYWCQGYSEPDAGSDLASLRMRAEADGDQYVVNGSKIWTTHAHLANRMFALVRTSDGARRQEGISFLLIDMDSPGISLRPIRLLGGDHELNQVFFDNVRVPRANLVGEEGAGWRCAKYLLEFERGADYASARLRTELHHAVRTATDAPLDNAALAARIFALEIDIDALEMMEFQQLAVLQAGGSPGFMASVLRLRSVELEQQLFKAIVDIMGSDALYWDERRPLYALDAVPTSHPEALSAVPKYLNNRAGSIAGGAAEIQRDIIARGLFGE
ncbi:MAG: acyl-CoA dehydrogenase family protein [Sphingobium sp.]